MAYSHSQTCCERDTGSSARVVSKTNCARNPSSFKDKGTKPKATPWGQSAVISSSPERAAENFTTALSGLTQWGDKYPRRCLGLWPFVPSGHQCESIWRLLCALKSCRALKARRGFTLVEIVISLLISTMILVAAASVFVTTLQSWEKGGRARKVAQTARSIQELIERNLRCAQPPQKKGDAVFIGESLVDGSSVGHRLTFMTSAPSRLGGGGVSIVEFSLDPATGEGLKMRVNPSTTDIHDPGGWEVVLSDAIKAFHVTYNNGSQWSDFWFDSGMPVAVQFHLVVADPDERPRKKSEDSTEMGGSSSDESPSMSSETPATSGVSETGETGAVSLPDGFSVTRLVSIPMGCALAHNQGGSKGGGSSSGSSRSRSSQ